MVKPIVILVFSDCPKKLNLMHCQQQVSTGLWEMIKTNPNPSLTTQEYGVVCAQETKTLKPQVLAQFMGRVSQSFKMKLMWSKQYFFSN